MYSLFVLEKNICFKKDKLYVYSQINSIKQLFNVYNKLDDENCCIIINEMIKKYKEIISSDNTKRTVTKTVILSDGTYGTVSEVLDVKEIKKQSEI